jgi:CO/xanthine dehydrogenase FAD-binding subunit
MHYGDGDEMPVNIPKSYFVPDSLEELKIFLADAGDQKLLYLAGGTDQVVDINERRLPSCDVMVYLDQITELKKISRNGDELIIGSGATHEAIAESADINRYFPVLAQACATVGSPGIRAVGTIGGNVARSSPAGDGATALLLLNVKVHTLGPGGERILNGLEFQIGPRRTLLEPGEMITKFTAHIPTGEKTGSVYGKLGSRAALSIAIVSCGTILTMSGDGTISDARISLGSVASKPIRAHEAEAVLVGKKPTECLFLEAAEVAKAHVCPIDDIRGSAEYRKAMVRAFTLRCSRHAWASLQ